MVLMPANLSIRISAEVFEVVTPTMIFPSDGIVPIPRLALILVVVKVAIPAERSSISTFASDVNAVAVVAVPVRFPVTSPVMPPIKLDAETAAAVNTPTIMLGVPARLSAVDAIPVTSPVTFPVISPTNDRAVTIPVADISVTSIEVTVKSVPLNEVAVIIPAESMLSGIFEVNNNGILSLEMVPEVI